MAKHYVTVNENGLVLRGFSDDFEQPNHSDICICEDGGRHFELGGVVNPRMVDLSGAPLYKMVDLKVTVRTLEEVEADKPTVIPVPTIDERLAEVEALVKGTPTYAELLEAVNILLEG